MKLNVKQKSVQISTHEGGKAVKIDAYKELRRTVCACFLWEDTFYEEGADIHTRIQNLCMKVKPEQVQALAIELRTVHNLRHVPLVLANFLARSAPNLVADTLYSIINRPDELSEFLAIYMKDGRKPVSRQVRKGLARAFTKFNEYSLGKYKGNGKLFSLRDVLRIARPKPANDDQSKLWNKVVTNTLDIPETWETMLSAGKDKKETFEYLLKEKKLGYFALLRNLRNMVDAKVHRQLIIDALEARQNGADKVLPFRYTAAARAAPSLESYVDSALLKSLDGESTFKGTTAVLVDVSGSMDYPLSAKSDLSRLDAAATLASIIIGDVRLFTFSYDIVEVPARKGMAGIEAIHKSQSHGGTNLGVALEKLNKNIKVDRLIVITDEQTSTNTPKPTCADKAYLINVSTYKNGVGYGNGWTHIDGFSENVLRYINEIENIS